MDWDIDATGLLITSGTCCGQEARSVSSDPVADLALEVAGGWWTRFAQIPFILQLLDTPYFELFCCWLAQGTPISSVHHECFQFRRCDTSAVHCGLPCIVCTAHQDAGNHDGVVHRRPALEFVFHSYELHIHTNRVVHSSEVPLFHLYCIFSVQQC